MIFRIFLALVALALSACDSGSSSHAGGAGGSTSGSTGSGDTGGGSDPEAEIARYDSATTHDYETNYDSAKWVEEKKSGDLGSSTFQ